MGENLQLFSQPLILWLVIISLCLIVGGGVKIGLRRIAIPGLLGYLAIGIFLRAVDDAYAFIAPEMVYYFDFMAEMGIIILLFKVGLESKLRALLKELPKASLIWVADVLISGAVAFVTAYTILGLSLITSLFTACALTATSIGVAVYIWQEQRKLATKTGSLLIDVSQLDDVSGILLLSFLLVASAGSGVVWSEMAMHGGYLLVVMLALLGLGVLFTQVIEPRISSVLFRYAKEEEPVLMILGTIVLIAVLSEYLGLSFAIGAFFAGVAFSRDPKVCKEVIAFDTLYELFTPFFFINIGLQFDFGVMDSSLTLGLMLLAAAIIGKFAAVWLGAIPFLTASGATLLAVSMVPRAEIALIIMQRGLEMGPDVVSNHLFSAMIIVVAGTIFISIPALLVLFRRNQVE